jgi:D-arginine dehydrogenase
VTAVDAVVIGGGIAGVSVAYELVARGMRVVLVEQEPQLAHHTTGRSAAVFLESYGPPEVRALSRASRPLYATAPDRLGTDLLLTPRASLWLAPADQQGHLATMLAELPGLKSIGVDEALAVCPVLRPDAFVAAALESDAAAIDVLGLHQGYVRSGRALGLLVDHSWPVSAITPRAGGGFTVSAAGGTVLETGAVVVAAGAWSDRVAALAGARPVGLEPKRRTIAVCRTAVELAPDGPLVGDCDHGYYWKPEGPNVLCSPADETPSDPCDARPEELDVALGLERVNATTRLALRSVVTAWAGLRTFAPDRVPVAGADPHVPGLWWSAGQGGYGIQTAPAQAALLAALIAGDPMPEGCRAAGVTTASLSPARFAT